MPGYNYDAEDAFEEYICFSAVFEQKYRVASDALEDLADMDDADPEYVRETVSKVMKPLMDLMEHSAGKYPWNPENIAGILQILETKEAARKFINSQYSLFEDYYALLPVIVPAQEAQERWNRVKTGFDAVLKELE